MGMLEKPSDLYDAIEKGLEARLAQGITFDDYADFDDVKLVDAMVLIEFQESTSASRSHDGRYCHQYDITLHAVVGKRRRRAGIEVVNMSAAIERVADENRWGLPFKQIDAPENIRASPSFFKKGSDGYEAWGVSFRQRIYLGRSLLEDDPEVREVWVATNPLDDNDPNQYEAISNDAELNP